MTTNRECPYCGCDLIINRGNYAGNLKYINEVQCFLKACSRWYTLTPQDRLYCQPSKPVSVSDRIERSAEWA